MNIYLEPYDEVNAASIAHIVGPHSATAKALVLLKERREAGETVGLFLDNRNKSVVVASVIRMLGDES